MARVENTIRQLRELAGETQPDLAQILGVDPSTISKWERREREVPDEFKLRLAAHYGLPVHSIFLFDPTTVHTPLEAVSQ